MSETAANVRRPALGSATNITLGLALLIAAGVWRAGEKLADVQRELATTFVSKEVFAVEMRTIREAIAELRLEIRRSSGVAGGDGQLR